MVVINISGDNFTLDGTEYPRIFIPLTAGLEDVSIVNSYDTNFQLLSPTRYDEFLVDGVTPTSQTNAIELLVDAIYKQVVLGGSGTDAGTFSGLSPTQFIRSDQNDTFTGTDLTLGQSNGTTITFSNTSNPDQAVEIKYEADDSNLVASGYAVQINSASNTPQGTAHLEVEGDVYSGGVRLATLNDLDNNATTVEGLNANQFLRSDIADSKTSGNLTLNDSVSVVFGNATNAAMSYNTSLNDWYLDLKSVDNLRFLNDGSSLAALERTTGDFKLLTGDLKIVTDSGVITLGAGDDMSLFYNGSNGYIDVDSGDLYIREGSTEQFRFVMDEGTLKFGNDNVSNADSLNTTETNTISTSANFSGSINYPTEFGQTLVVRGNDGADGNRNIYLHKVNGDQHQYHLGYHNSSTGAEWTQVWTDDYNGGGSDNLGDHTATQDLDMADNAILGVDYLNIDSATDFTNADNIPTSVSGDSFTMFSPTTGSSNYPTTFGQVVVFRGPDADGSRDIYLFKSDGDTPNFNIGYHHSTTGTEWAKIWTDESTEVARTDIAETFDDTVTFSDAVTCSSTVTIASGLTVQSTVTATDFVLSSDESLKSDIEPLEVKKINADWKTYKLDDVNRVGVIAQELEQTHPEFVREGADGLKAVSYIDLLIAKVAELEARIKELEK